MGRHAGAARKRLAELRPGPSASSAAQPSPAAAERALDLDPVERAAIQRHLSRLGQQPGPADGVFGPRTRLAISAWQRANGLAATGHLTRSQIRVIAAQAEGLATETAARDGAWWQQTGASGDAEGLRAYLHRYPQGLHAEAARRLLSEAGTDPDPPRGDEATWRWARRQGSAAAYETYLERFPRGAHAAGARERLATLRAGIEAARREEAVLGLTPSARRLIEERLHSAGMQPGPVDGAFTDETRAALRRYQAARNLRVTGYVTQQTVSGLLADVLR
ncbi:peptidoglycan-binding domain-containing protein [Paracoccus sp. PXZ]